MAMLGDEKYNRAQRAKTVGFTDAAISDYNATTAANTAAVQDRNSKIGRTGMFGYNTAMDIKGLTPIKDAAKSGYDAVTGAKGAADAANTANAANAANAAKTTADAANLANTANTAKTAADTASTVNALRTTGEVANVVGNVAAPVASTAAATGGATGALAAMGPVGWISAALLAADLF